MAQFKDVFLGTGIRDYSRAVNSQKMHKGQRKTQRSGRCWDMTITTIHFLRCSGTGLSGTILKKEAIEWAWELMTEEWELPKEKMWATVFAGGDGVGADEDAEKIGSPTLILTSEQVLRFDKNDNFWEISKVGPCGPCSELHIDLGQGTCPFSASTNVQ